MNKPRISVVIPCFNEGVSIIPVLDRIKKHVSDFECLIVVDSLEDSTISILKNYSDPRFRYVLNNLGSGPAKAIKSGIGISLGTVIVVTMADGSDDPELIEKLSDLVDRGVSIACASRYMPGGQLVGAPFIKSQISKLAGLSLYYFRRVGTRDATNSFKAYSSKFLKSIELESDSGFELGLELVAKARISGEPVAEIPTIWIERNQGKSNFKLMKWIPKYLKWYFYAFKPISRK